MLYNWFFFLLKVSTFILLKIHVFSFLPVRLSYVSIGMVTVASPLLPPQISSVEAVFSLNLNTSTPIHFKMIGSRENYGIQFPM